VAALADRLKQVADALGRLHDLDVALALADKPIGEWNTLHVTMVGTRVWVTLNGTPVVVGQVLDNFFDRAQPVLPSGSIELQTHGSEVRFRNVFVREIPKAEGDRLLATVAK